MPAVELISTEPATGAVIWQGPTGDVAAEVAAARAAWPDWAARPLAFRAETLRRFANLVRARAEAITDQIARETGKPLWDARSEAEAVLARVDAAIAAYGERTGQRRLEGNLGVRSALRHKPHGVLAVIGQSSFPVQQAADHVIPALLAGNAVVLKPSEHSPAAARALIATLVEAGVPEGVARWLPGGPETGRALAADPGIDGLLFSGSTPVGLGLARQFAEMPGRMLTLAMGGNNPIVVWDAADLHAAAVIIVQSAFLSAGQRCSAARRLIVRDGQHGPLVEAVTKIIDRLIIGEPHSQPAPFMGPVIGNAAADMLQDAFLDLMMKGGQPIRRLDRPIDGRPFLTPALIDVTAIQRRPDVELFGPILQMVRVPDFEAALVEANATRYGLSASLIGGSPQLYDRFWATIRAGAINWNRPTTGSPATAPFGGLGLSGNYRPGSYYAADHSAYPVISTEVEQARAAIGVGLR